VQYGLFGGPHSFLWRWKPVVDLLLVRDPAERLEHAFKYRVLQGKSLEIVVLSAVKTYDHQFLIGGLVVPLIATVGINNKVTFLEKYGTSEYANSTGAYELDISLVDNYQLAWREMHVKSDVFCSGSIILPDKGARQINVGGWSLESTYGVRLYYPDGKEGVNGTHDWQENVNELTLQVCCALHPRLALGFTWLYSVGGGTRRR